MRNSPLWTCVELTSYPFNIPKKFDLECDPDMKYKFAYLGMSYNVSMCIGAVFIGGFLDRLGRKFTIIMGGSAFLLTLICMYYVDD